MTLREALTIAVRMRVAQMEFFKTRDRSALVTSKKLEKEFDNAIGELNLSGEQDHELR